MKNISATLILIIIALAYGCATNQVVDLRTIDQKKIEEFALLAIPVEIDVVHHNQKSLSTRPAYQETIRYRLAPGHQVIGLQYNNLVPNEDGVKEKVKSHIVQINFMAEKGREYYIPFQNPDSFKSAVSLSKEFELQLYSGQQLIATSVVNDLWQSTTMPATSLTHDTNLPAAGAPAGEHLNYWWTKATEQEKNRFLVEIYQNKNQ